MKTSRQAVDPELKESLTDPKKGGLHRFPAAQLAPSQAQELGAGLFILGSASFDLTCMTFFLGTLSFFSTSTSPRLGRRGIGACRILHSCVSPFEFASLVPFFLMASDNGGSLGLTVVPRYWRRVNAS